MSKKKAINTTERVIYMGPRLNAFGIGYGAVFYNGLHARLQQAIEKCPAIQDMLVPVAQASAVRKELNFDYAHNMKGTDGRFVTLYREIQKWLNSQSRQTQPTPRMEIKHA
jgi:hypothetical protein